MRAEMSSAGVALRESIIIPEMSKTTGITIESLVLEHSRTVFKVAYSVVRNQEDAEDVAQETFLRALKHGRFNEIENHKAWLAKIAWRLAIDRTSHATAEPLDDIIATLRSTDQPLEDAIGEQQRSALMRKLIDALPTDLREVVVLSTVEEMTSADVASAMGIPEGSVRTRMMRARQMMKQKLAAMLEKK
jgi:RNA polymerase sigma-70 factor, ECF subfamily